MHIKAANGANIREEKPQRLACCDLQRGRTLMKRRRTVQTQQIWDQYLIPAAHTQESIIKASTHWHAVHEYSLWGCRRYHNPSTLKHLPHITLWLKHIMLLRHRLIKVSSLQLCWHSLCICYGSGIRTAISTTEITRAYAASHKHCKQLPFINETQYLSLPWTLMLL